jgi:hypothetical protein
MSVMSIAAVRQLPSLIRTSDSLGLGWRGLRERGFPLALGALLALQLSGCGSSAGGTLVSALEALPTCTGTISQIFSKSAIQPPATGSGIFNAVDSARCEALEDSIRAAVQGDLSRALASAQTAAYEVCRSEDSGALVVIFRPQVTGEGHAVVAWRAEGARPLIVEAPHAFHDVDTELEATEMFLSIHARALVLSGTYRCASFLAGPCDGYTTACTGLPIPYTISDAAHNSEMLFQAAHVALAESFKKDSVTSLHGMEDPGISISNGTQMSPAADSLEVRLIGELSYAFVGEQITMCQDYPGTTTDNRWCGSENVQGRHVNGSPDVCAANATISSNRFVHVEQSRAIRDARAQVIEAFGRALK